MAVTMLSSVDATGKGLDAFATEPVSLARLNESAIRIEWFEAVAIIQELCRSLADSSSDSSGRPLNASHVEVDRAGSVLLTREGHLSSVTVRQVGELLRGLLADDIPVPLRLALSQSVSEPPFYPSVMSFSQALAYFERPNRNALIQAVYNRWKLRPTENRTHPEVPFEPLKQHAAELPNVQRARLKLPQWFVVTTIVLGSISVLTMTALLMLPRRAETAASQSVANPILAAGSSVAKTVSSLATAAINKITTTAAPAPSLAESVEAPEPVVTAPVRRVVQARPLRTIPLFPLTPRLEDLSLKPIFELQSLIDVELSNPTPNTHNPSFSEQMAPGNIYSDLDLDVEPPVAVYPQIPSALFGPPEQDAAIFDVIIDRFGKVESAKLRQRPTSMANAMVLTMGLSAAKAWRFQPATRQGQPVKYRKTIWMPAR